MQANRAAIYEGAGLQEGPRNAAQSCSYLLAQGGNLQAVEEWAARWAACEMAGRRRTQRAVGALEESPYDELNAWRTRRDGLRWEVKHAHEPADGRV